MRTAIAVMWLACALQAQETPKKLFAALKGAVARPGGAYDELFAREALEGRDKGLAGEIARATLHKVRKQGDQAVLELELGEEVRELMIERKDRSWFVASSRSYLVDAATLEKRLGKEPAVIRLEMRTTNRAYGKTAYSFTHVTQDPVPSKNRMDIWYCHNGDFHSNRDGRIASLGKRPLSKVRGLPVGVEWSDTQAVEKGQAYVLHCWDGTRMDFYVKLRVRSVRRGVVELEWTLLSDGLNAPASIRKVQPDTSNDGADGEAGLCGKHG